MIERLAGAQGSNSETINIALANELVATSDTVSIKELIGHLTDKDKTLASDCVKVLYEVGKINPVLIAEYFDDFLLLLKSKNNRLVWGAMMALSQIAKLNPEKADDSFSDIVSAYKSGSVITVDYAISMFAEISNIGGRRSRAAYDMIIGHLSSCRPKEVPQHAERAWCCITPENAEPFKSVLESRMEQMTENQQKRLKRLFTKIEKKAYAE